MPNRIRPLNSIKVSGIAQHVRNKYIRASTPFRIDESGIGYYIVDGEMVSVEDFDKLCPVIVLKPIAAKGNNSDRTKAWMHDNKSF